MKRLALLAAYQVATILGWAGYHEHVRATAPTFRIPLRPVDPYDVLRGRYFRLNPLDARIDSASSGSILSQDEVRGFMGRESLFTGSALVGFCPEEGHHRVCALARIGDAPSGGPTRLWSRAYVVVQSGRDVWRESRWVKEPGWMVQIELGLDRFFLPNRASLPARENARGWELEVSYRPEQPLLPRRLWLGGKPVELD